MAGEEGYLDRAIGRYSPKVAATARAALAKVRARFPGARQLVYERRRSLPIGFAPAERGSAVFSLVLYPRWVRFFFLEGAALEDPEGRLEGTGSQVRSIRVDEHAAILDDRYIRGLMTQALKVAGAGLKTGRAQLVLKSTIFTSRRGALKPVEQPLLAFSAARGDASSTTTPAPSRSKPSPESATRRSARRIPTARAGASPSGRQLARHR